MANEMANQNCPNVWLCFYRRRTGLRQTWLISQLKYAPYSIRAGTNHSISVSHVNAIFSIILSYTGTRQHQNVPWTRLSIEVHYDRISGLQTTWENHCRHEESAGKLQVMFIKRCPDKYRLANTLFPYILLVMQNRLGAQTEVLWDEITRSLI